jgi:lysozyme C
VDLPPARVLLVVNPMAGTNVGFSEKRATFVARATFLGLALASAVGCAATTEQDDGEDVAESADRLLAGRRIKEAEAATLIREAGFPEAAVGKMLCTIKYESNFYERALNRNRNGSTDYGLFQINSIHVGRAGCPRTAAGLYDAAANARCASTIYDSQGINAWYGYKRHRSECDRYEAPPPSGRVSSPGATDDEGGCYSGTLEDIVPARSCVQSKLDERKRWLQCKDGQWYRGVSDGVGPYGRCTSEHALP